MYTNEGVKKMKEFYILYWTIGASKASCGLEPIRVRFHCKAKNKEMALKKLFTRHDDLDEGNIVSIQES